MAKTGTHLLHTISQIPLFSSFPLNDLCINHHHLLAGLLSFTLALKWPPPDTILKPIYMSQLYSVTWIVPLSLHWTPSRLLMGAGIKSDFFTNLLTQYNLCPRSFFHFTPPPFPCISNSSHTWPFFYSQNIKTLLLPWVLSLFLPWDRLHPDFCIPWMFFFRLLLSDFSLILTSL